MTEDTLSPRYFDREGQPISLEEWSRLHRSKSYATIAKTSIPGTHIQVSTVWLGLNRNFSRQGNPVIFETMVFWNGPEWCDRWTTEGKAKNGHWLTLIAFLKHHPDEMDKWSAHLSQPNYEPTEIDLKILELLEEFK